MSAASRRSGQARADHPDRDRGHREVLVFARVLAEHPLAQQQQHEQPARERRLDDHERCEQQGQQLQGKAEYRQARAQQPAPAPEQSPCERQAQMLLVRRLLRIKRLEGDP
jgi:hypothetical protein